MVTRQVFKASHGLKLAKKHPTEDMIVRVSEIMVLFGVMLGFIALLYIIPVMKLPGTTIGAALIIPDNSSYSAFAVKALNMGLDFMIIQSKDPDVISRCEMDKIKYDLNCIVIPGTTVEGHELKVCDVVEPGCEAITMREPWEMERAVLSCKKFPNDCQLRPFPLWHRTFLKWAAIAYFLYAVISILLGHESLHKKVIKAGRNVL